MKSDLKKLITVEGMVETEVIKSKLESYDIPCMVRFESAGRLFGITLNGLGKASIMVRPRDYERARALIETKKGTKEPRRGPKD